MDDRLKRLKEHMDNTVLNTLNFHEANKSKVRKAIYNSKKNKKIKNLYPRILSIGFSCIFILGISYFGLEKFGFIQPEKEKDTANTVVSPGKIYDSNGKVIGDNALSFDNALDSKVLSEVKKGNNLKLTVDMDLQYEVEKIIEEELIQKKNLENTDLLDRAFVVMMDPNTGEILTMAGKQYVKDEETGKMEINDFALGNITTSYTMGTVVTGATILTGYETGAINPGDSMVDAPMYLKGTPQKRSWKNMGVINDVTALKQSSNVYMFKTAINIGEGEYRPNESLSLNKKAFDTMRHYFNQFGLGVATGIDLTGEMAGFQGKEKVPGKLLDLSIGQYDKYTPLQLVQYVSTIANGGKRIQPHLLKEIRKPTDKEASLGPIIQKVSPVVLNRVDMEPKLIERVQTGFEKVMQEEEGTGYRAFGSADYKPAGKTGVAEAFYDGPLHKNNDEPLETMNLSLVSYAPANNPEVAMAVVVPWAYQGEAGSTINLEIGRKVMDKYFELKGNSKTSLSEGEEKNADVKE